jgi:iron(III) transport system permease protein
VVNSLVIAGAVTIVSTILGVFFAWLVSRTDLPFKETMKLLFLVPFMLPSFIGAIAWKILLSPRAGLINKGFMSLLGTEQALFNIYSLTGIIAVESMYLFPSSSSRSRARSSMMDPTLRSRRASPGRA